MWAFSSLGPYELLEAHLKLSSSSSLMLILNFQNFFPEQMQVCAECDTGIKFPSHYIKTLNSV